MCEIWTMGEMLVEIMRPEPDMPLNMPASFLGPYPSGAPAIFIDTAARLGHSAGIFGGVGKDDFGDILLTRLKKDGVNTDYVFEDEHASTAVAFVTYFSDGSRKFIYHIGNTPAVHPKPFRISDIGGAKYFHIMGCSLMANEAFRDRIIDAAMRFSAAGAKISFDPNIRRELLGGRKIGELLNGLLEKCAVLMPGVDELAMLTGEEDIDAGVEKLFLHENMEVVALKKGSRGSTIYTRGGAVDCPPYPVEQVDPTGSGDCYDAALLCGLIEGKPAAEAGKMASAAGALNAMRQGPMEGDIGKEQIGKMIYA